MNEMARRARLRPANYSELSAREQWEIDKSLGILDWDGSADERADDSVSARDTR